MDATKKKISSIVKDYAKQYPEENKFLKQAVIMKRALYSKGFEKGTDMKPLFELSETLHSMLIGALTSDEITWFKTKKGGNWFAKEFKNFSLI